MRGKVDLGTQDVHHSQPAGHHTGAAWSSACQSQRKPERCCQGVHGEWKVFPTSQHQAAELLCQWCFTSQYLFKKTNQSHLAWVQRYTPVSSTGTGEKGPEVLLARTPTGSAHSEQGRKEQPHQCERFWVPLTSRLL